LDGEITREFYEQKSGQRRREQEDILRKIEKHHDANGAYLDEGVRLIELAQHAAILYEKQSMEEKRRLLNFVLSNSIWKDGTLIPNYRKPFDLIASTNIAYQQKKTASGLENGLFDNWLPGLVPQSVLVWDGVRIEMERAAQNHVKISLLPEMIQLQSDPLHADGLSGRKTTID